MAKSFPYIEVSGTNYQIGCAIGEHIREKIQDYGMRMKALYSTLVKGSGYNLGRMATKTKRLTEKYFPQYLDELRGIANGSGISLNEMLLLCSEETLLETIKGGKCTTFAYACSEGALLCHNEDWLPGYEDDLYIVKAKPKKGASFLSLAYIGALPGSSVALNNYGIAFSGNSLLGGAQEGLPKNIILRSQIEARTLEEFEKIASFSPRAIPNHSMAIDKEGHMLSMELALDRYCAFYTNDAFFVHTNHALHPHIASLEIVPIKDSTARYNTAFEKLQNNRLSSSLAKKILRSHDKEPYTICAHAKTEEGHNSQTAASIIVNVNDVSMLIAQGNPCKSKYKAYSL